MRYLLVCLCILLGGRGPVFATDGMEYQIDDERVISCGSAIAGAILQSDEARVLTSIDLLMADAPGPEGGFSVSLYDDIGTGEPGTLVAVLNGDENPKVAGRYVYRCPEDVVLDAGKRYWVVASVVTPDAAYRYQVIEAESAESDRVCNSFLRLGDGSAELGDSPAIFATFGGGGTGIGSVKGDQFKLLWTLLLSGVILFCCFDLLPFYRSSASI